nr:unnamed protein product [Callosobruchus analis]
MYGLLETPTADPVRQGIWISLLGIDSPTELPNVTLVCSKHFNGKDFTYNSAGKRHLKDGADPLDSNALQYEQGYASSDSTVTASPSKEIEAFTSSSETLSCVGSPVRKRLRMEDLAVPGPSHVM